ncbi:energy transducer TonB [uncultured Sphingomonas sp.]|uniref:energy transducer TonB n=1 Tax=uncultured Sphingomonas sp. TaxID=158754 RepID=UPI0025FDB279|nr:energy transducer TonB [uncultured Sphingomonas sp.]
MTSGLFAQAGLAGLIVVTGAGAAAQQGAPTAAKSTAQQQYDAATALDAGKDATAALDAWTAFAGRYSAQSRNWAIATVRKGGALYRLGRLDEAATTIRAGLAALPAKDSTLVEDRYNAHMMLGRIATESLDYADATSEYGKAEAVAPDDVGRLSALLAGARVQTFTDPTDAQATLDRADALATKVPVTKVDQAMLAQARLRLDLNTNRFAEAIKIAPRVVSLLGGMTLDKVDLRDVAARSDAAMAALLSHNDDRAREYMAYTGAGRSAKGNFEPASLMVPPECGGDADLKPDDVAVVQFGVGDDGSTFAVEPIYSSGGGQKALAFARAVRGWVWTPESMKTLPPFFRYSVRLELRCSTSFARPSVAQDFDSAFADWLKIKGIARAGSDTGPRGGAAVLEAQRAALKTAEATGQGPAILAAIDTLRSNPVLGADERRALLTRADAIIAAQTDMPAMARLNFELPTRLTQTREFWREGRYAAAVSPLLTEKPYVDDPQARSALRLLIADSSSWKQAEPYLQQVVDDGALPARDPLKVGALIRLASIAQRRGDIAAARQTFEKTGLAASQCATLDATPKAVSIPNGDAFPQEAQRWGFEGWVRNQFDIGADGRVANTRTIVSYPPFIFSQAAEKMFGATRYQKTYRPDGGLGCGASVSGVRFRLPGRS